MAITTSKLSFACKCSRWGLKLLVKREENIGIGGPGFIPYPVSCSRVPSCFTYEGRIVLKHVEKKWNFANGSASELRAAVLQGNGRHVEFT